MSPPKQAHPQPHQPNFDRVARLYRWCEYAALGSLLERTRLHHLPALAACRRALILGDGDGRFTAHLLATHPQLHAHAVDLSPRMLHLLRNRVHRTIANADHRLQTTQSNALHLTPTFQPDLIVTHFFLDCLTQKEVSQLITQLLPTLAPNALWLVSEFRVPSGLLRWPARAYIRSLYLAFRLLTGLRVTSLPDYAAALRSAGFEPLATQHLLGGILTTELWRLRQTGPAHPTPSATLATR